MSWDKIVKLLAGVAGAVLGLFGEWTQMHTILVAVMATDYITGCVVAACGRSPKTEGGGLSSKVGFIGLAKKGFIMAIVLLATLLDRAMGNTAMIFQSACLCYYIANEALSILENADALGVPFPDKIKKAFESMRDKGGKGEDADGLPKPTPQSPDKAEAQTPADSHDDLKAMIQTMVDGEPEDEDK